MRTAVLAFLLATNVAATWSDVPALVASATAPVDADLRACSSRKTPWTIALIATRDPKTGDTRVAMPMPPVGGRGFTADEQCLMRVVATISLPRLPAGVERVVVGHEVGATGPADADAAWTDWRDLEAALAALLDADHRKALAACDARPRTVRLVLDLRKGATRVWLPAWQFHAPTGDGSTPPAQRKVKACLRRAIATWKPPVLPKAMAELELAIESPSLAGARSTPEGSAEPIESPSLAGARSTPEIDVAP